MKVRFVSCFGIYDEIVHQHVVEIEKNEGRNFLILLVGLLSINDQINPRY